MKVIKSENAPTRELTNEPLFTGGKVMGRFLIGEDVAKDIGMALISFRPGARNIFHTHSAGQVLYVTEGKGIVATEKEEVVVTPGMVVYIPPGEKHWHGATKDSSFAHLSITPPHKTQL